VIAPHGRRAGRKRDLSRNGPILQAALTVLSEIGYERMTTDMVAARARTSKATLYRRWPSKADLVAEAVESLSDGPELVVPDTGSLAGDLAAMVRAQADHSDEQKLRIMSGLLSILPHDAELAKVVQRRIVQPRTAAVRIVLERAQARGEIAAGRDLDALSMVVPAITAFRLVVTGEPVDEKLIESVIREVLLPASFAGVVDDFRIV
jgi:AcrR family transcriptional regulator